MQSAPSGQAVSRIATSLVLWVAACLAAGQSTLLRSIFPNPTGTNGYEDYLRAADLLNDGLIEVYLDGVVDPQSPPVLIRAREDTARSLRGLDYLAQKQAVVRRYGKALDLVVLGNSKPSFDPRGLDTPRFPEFRYFRQLVRLAVAKAYVLSAGGDHAGAVQTLREAMIFIRRFSAKTNIGNLYGIISLEYVFEGFSELMPAVSLEQAQALQADVSSALAEPSSYVSGLATAAAAEDEILKKAMEAPKEALSSFSREDVTARISTASPADLQALGRALRKAVHDRYAHMIADLHAPEQDWYRLSESWPKDSQPGRIAADSPMEDVAEAICADIVPSYHRSVVTELRRRAQLRILALHAGIRAYRWRNHRLPTKLSEVGSEFDPLSSEAFVYELSSDGSYRLYSKGRPESGPVELKYVRPPQDRADLPPLR